MATSDAVLTCRYVSDGEVGRRASRDRWKRLRHPALLLATAVVGGLVGVGASVITYHGSLPEYLGRVVVIGLIWGVYWILALALFTAALVFPLARWRERRISAQYPAGSVTEILLGAEDLVIVRPSGDRSEIGYRGVRRVRTFGSLQAIYSRSSFWPELLPTGALTEEALTYLDDRMRGDRPGSVDDAKNDVTQADVTRSFVVPPGWAAHVAGVYTRSVLRRRAFLVRFGLVAMALVVLAALESPWWALLIPSFLAVTALSVYVPTRRMLDRVVPDGSVATTDVFEDRLVSRNAGGVREIRYADVRAIEVRGDVVLIRMTTERNVGVIARALIPDELPQRLRGVA
jgi:hypothetical protein